jgi:hypothetical protein
MAPSNKDIEEGIRQANAIRCGVTCVRKPSVARFHKRICGRVIICGGRRCANPIQGRGTSLATTVAAECMLAAANACHYCKLYRSDKEDKWVSRRRFKWSPLTLKLQWKSTASKVRFISSTGGGGGGSKTVNGT